MTHHALLRMSGPQLGKYFEVTAPMLSMWDTAILGQFNNVECHSGLMVHATETEEAHDLNVQWRMQPVLAIAIILQGTLNAWLDDKPLNLGRPEGGAGHVWTLTEPTLMRRESQKGMHVRKVIISVPPEWIGVLLRDHKLPNENLSRFVSTHRAMMDWTPSKHVLSLAEQILNPTEGPKPIQNMAVESKAIEIVREALSFIISPATAAEAGTQRVASQFRAQRIRRYLQENLDRNPSLQTMAREFGLSVGSMQAAFKKSYRTTIAEFRRDLRLQQARAAIEQEGVSVSEAAYRAGYANPASFSTAFKRRFGFAPSIAKE